jgi:hypothetical protein
VSFTCAQSFDLICEFFAGLNPTSASSYSETARRFLEQERSIMPLLLVLADFYIGVILPYGKLSKFVRVSDLPDVNKQILNFYQTKTSFFTVHSVCSLFSPPYPTVFEFSEAN